MKIIALHNNYAAHNKSTHSTLNETEHIPMLYTLPDTALLLGGRPFFIPEFANPCTAEVQLVFRICRLGRSISERFAHRYYDAITTGVTFTAQNVFDELRRQQAPWELCKGFDGAATIGRFLALNELSDWQSCAFSLQQSGQVVQCGKAEDMLMHIDRAIAYVSRFYTLRQGDYIFTGCPVAPIKVSIDDRLQASIDHHTLLAFNVK